MSSPSESTFENLLRDNDLTWMVDGFLVPREKVIESLLNKLSQASTESVSRFGDDAPRFTAEFLANESQKHHHKVRAFLQGLSAGMTPPMLVMVWRILQGSYIQEVDVHYRKRSDFKLRIILSSSSGSNPECYESSDIWDASVLRHLGIMKANDLPVFDGFMPLQFRTADTP